MHEWVLDFQDVDRTSVGVVGGKGASLGELARIEGVLVPAGFCITTHAFERILQRIGPSLTETLDRLAELPAEDLASIAVLSADARRLVEEAAIPGEVADAIAKAHARFGTEDAYAVRSSATAEDSPTTSFAGQQDTYLNVVGREELLRNVSRCWASLYSERAVTYRLRRRVPLRGASTAVVVQRMVRADAAGVAFTADPVTSSRKVVSIDAVFGLGEALVSGRVNPDGFKVKDGKLVAKTLATGTPTLTDAQAIELAALARVIEDHFGRPQDIEWCLAEGRFHFVQSRPITTLFPIPNASDEEPHVYVSVGHNQMMTDAMKPLGISFWQMTTPRPMSVAGGRLFVDVTQTMRSKEARAAFIAMWRRSDELTGDALASLALRDDFLSPLPDGAPTPPPAITPARPDEIDPALVRTLVARTEASIADAEKELATKTGPDLFDAILADIQELRRRLFDPESRNVIMAAMEAAWWLADHLQSWLGERNAVDALSQSLDGNVTSEMGLALLDVADVVRPHAEVVHFLSTTTSETFMGELPSLEGGAAARAAIAEFLEKYGMRCVGEFDITRPRWAERPLAIVPMILANVKGVAPGAGRQRFTQGKEAARAKEEDVLRRLRALPGGEEKAAEAKARIDRIRALAGYREFPKYGMVSRYWIYKRALLREAKRLVETGALREEDDALFLSFEELHDASRTGRVDQRAVDERKIDFRFFESLTPPRVLTSDGEVVHGSYRRENVPAGALVGLPVSAGVVEGRARVVLDVAGATLEDGDILVTSFTDPSWTPLFLVVKGLVTEVGGLMTHGAVIAREYGIPAVVAVENATTRIRDGERIRVDGTAGFVEVLRAQR